LSIYVLEEEVQFQGPDDLGAQFTEIFIKKSDNVGLLLSLLEVLLYL
jgi:hypothetical protein